MSLAVGLPDLRRRDPRLAPDAAADARAGTWRPRGAGGSRWAQILTQAFRDPSFTLIFLGFFSCGYQLAFITAHFPAW
jgi:hypothetical protein